MDSSWIFTSWYTVFMAIISTLGIYIFLILCTRIYGVRSFSKMSSYDFAITIAIGSVLASTILFRFPSLVHATVAMGTLFGIQMLVAHFRSNSSIMSKLVDNEPILLMKNTEIIEKNLKRAQVTHSDLRAKLREANVTQMTQIQAVVMESTGDISVLHHDDPDHDLDNVLLKGVQGWDS
ncbi:DUF421 domain-containing protein [Fodinibius sp. AD559]|uniref:DUF421 domain-containing protein n=1 Tax=Fodinibius sp. AD559 TaxID=3424179 RepID=UPI004046E70F